jgi:hypothetical protein
VPTAVVGSLVLCGGFAVALYLGIASVMEDSEPYRTAMARAAASPAVVEKLGAPLARDGMVQGQLNFSGDSGRVDIRFPVKGPKGPGTLFIAGTQSGGKWSYSTLEIRLPGGQGAIPLLPTIAPAGAGR